MVWGTGRLLVFILTRALRVARPRVSPVARRAALWVGERDRRLVRRVTAATVLLALVGPGRPLLAILGDTEVRPSAAAVGEAGDRGRFAHWAEARQPERAGASVPLPRSASLQRRPAEVEAIPAKRTALIVGIDHAKGGRPLPGSVTDATNLRKALLGYGFPSHNVTMLLDGKATRSAILAHLDALAARTPRDGIAVFAVATHTRRKGGTNELLTADGLRISAYELASRLGHVRSPMWVALPTCYAGGYALRGIVGPKRIATFASPKDEPTYQLGTAGSYLMINMVRKAMLEGRAPDSVEDAFGYAKRSLEESHPNRVPIMSDGIDGDLVLGDHDFSTAASRQTSWQPAPQPESRYGRADAPTSSRDASEEAGPSPTPTPRRKGKVGVCGKFAYNCSSN